MGSSYLGILGAESAKSHVSIAGKRDISNQNVGC